MSEEEKKDVKNNIENWENEKQRYLDDGDIMSAVMCEILAENLRKEIGESKYEWRREDNIRIYKNK